MIGKIKQTDRLRELLKNSWFLFSFFRPFIDQISGQLNLDMLMYEIINTEITLIEPAVFTQLISKFLIK